VTTTATLTTQLTDWVAQHGVYAVFGLMAVDALVPVGGELVMLYAGVVAAGAASKATVTVFGISLASGAPSYVALALAGSFGYLFGALVGWSIGVRGGRPLIERHGRWLHLSPEAFDRAERWFARFGPRAVFLGRLTPLVRSFISVPAGVLGSPLASYTILTLLGSLIWCFGFAGVGWAVGGSWETVHHDFRYADYVVVVALVALVVAILAIRRRRTSALRR
jgi:membrane protein DedA with SNARE-associated domain